MNTCPVCGIGIDHNSIPLISEQVLNLLRSRAVAMNMSQQQIVEYSLIRVLMVSTECEDMKKHYGITSDVENGLIGQEDEL